LTPKQHFTTQAALLYVHADLCLPTTPFLLLQTLPIQTSVLDSRFAYLAGACCLLNLKLFCTVAKLLVWWSVLTVNMCYSILYAILHSMHCLLGCKFLTFLHPVVPSFIFPTTYSIVKCITNCCIFFWIPCILTSKSIRIVEYFICD